MIIPFTCHIPQPALEELKSRLKNTRWTDEITGSGWQAGASLSYMKELVAYWIHQFDWRKVEAEINQLPGFKAEIDDVSIHFLHIKGKGKKTIPLILTHGWPGSFLEMRKIIPFLTTQEDISFDLVIPSLVGFGFSQKITQPGCNSQYIASLWVKLMQALGYQQFGLQGGDIGAGVSTALALHYPETTLGLHLNYIPGSYTPYLKKGERLTREEQEYKDYYADWSAREGAYSHLHSTKPLTLAYGLNDSPVALCAWILEKFYSWSDCNGNIESVFSKDDLLANITLYWLTESIHSSIRIYYENRKAPLHFTKDEFIYCPVGIARFPKEISFPPRRYVERGYNVMYWNEHSSGGHFAAMEQPELLAHDISQLFKSI